MAARKKRPVLYEVYRPSSKGVEVGQKLHSTQSSGHQATMPPSPCADVPVRTLGNADPVAGTTAKRKLLTISPSTLAILIASAAVLLAVAFSAGRRFEAVYSSGEPQAVQPLHEDGDVASKHQAESGLDARQANEIENAPAAADQPQAIADATPGNASGGQPPRVTLQKGYHYIVVQHFGKKVEDARETAQFLIEHGIGCAILPSSQDNVVVATQPFLISQSDSAAAKRERRSAQQLMKKIKTVGKEFKDYRLAEGKKHYTLSKAYLLEIK